MSGNIILSHEQSEGTWARVPSDICPSERTVASEPFQGAEPIFLHVLRPVIKPYTSTLDVLLDGGAMFGDFIFLVASIPVRRVRDWWDSWTIVKEDAGHEADPVKEKNATQQPDDVVPPFLRESANGARPAARRKGSATSSTSSVRSAASQRTSAIPQRPANSQHPSAKTQRPPAKSAFVPVTANASVPPAARTFRASRIYHEPTQGVQPPPPPYERWVPPASAYTERGQSGLPTPPADSPPPFEAVATADAEWRQYPDFPAAYPPTPLQTTSQTLPGGLVAPVPLRAPQFARIAEEGGNSDEEEGGATVRQGSQQSRREFTNPELAGDFCDDHAPNGAHGKEVFSDDMDTDAHGDEDVSIDESDSQEGESEDDFGMSLRTPRRMRIRPKAQDETIKARKNIYGTANLSDESLASTSTKLSTTDNGSSLRTNSVASQASSSRQSSIAPSTAGSDASSTAGRKGRIPPMQRTNSGGSANPAKPTTAKSRAGAKPGQQPQPQRVKKANATGVRPTAVQLQTRMRARDEPESEDEDAEGTDGELSDPGVAGRGLKRKQAVRPRAPREDSERTLRPRKTGAANATGSTTKTNSQTSVRGRR